MAVVRDSDGAARLCLFGRFVKIARMCHRSVGRMQKGNMLKPLQMPVVAEILKMD